MTTQHNPDNDLIAEEDAPLIAAYRDGSTDVPGPHIDNAIRAAARRAVGARPQTLGKFRWSTWRTPLATAATVVLSATVVYWTARDEGIDKLATPVPSQSPSPLPSSESSVVALDSVIASMESKSRASMSRGALLAAPPAGVGTAKPEARLARPTEFEDAGKREQQFLLQRAQKEKATTDRAMLGAGPSRAPEVRRQEQSLAKEVKASEAEKVERIRQLVREGRKREALEDLAVLRRDNPDYPLPADLSELAKELSPTAR